MHSGINLTHINWPDGLDEQRFLEEYWQKRPLLIRQAFPDFETPLPADELAGLSLESDTTPRLITQDETGQYQLENGPFDEHRFTQLTGNNWSLLVTDVEKHLPDIAEYLIPFQFLPSWRIDDLMVSYAPEGASVGAHVDEYDVFLLQASGSRRWMIDASDQPDLRFDTSARLKILSTFNPSDTWDLVPGDMLYLPPNVPHHGVAISDECTTWSVGFRAPMLQNIMQSFVENMSSEKLEQRYRDPAMPVSTPGKINAETLEAFAGLWRDLSELPDESIALLTGKLLTALSIDSERDTVSQEDIEKAYWVKHPFSRCAYSETTNGVNLFADGEAYSSSIELAKAVCTGNAVCLSDLQADDIKTFQQLIEDGCLQVQSD